MKDEFAPADELTNEAFLTLEWGVGGEDSVDDFLRGEEATIDEGTEKAMPKSVVLSVDCIFIGSEAVEAEFDEIVEFFEGMGASDRPIEIGGISGVRWKQLGYGLHHLVGDFVGREPGSGGRNQRFGD